MNLIVATIPGSGTFSLLGMLNYERRNMKPIHEASEGLRFTHLYDDAMDILMSTDHDIVTTHRDVERIYATWRRRGMDVAGLDEHFKNYDRLLTRRPYLVRMWRS